MQLKILIPTDFSPHAKNALDFGIDMCNRIGGELHLLSAYQIQRSASTLINLADVIKENTLEDLKRIESYAKLKLDSKVHIESHVTQSSVPSAISNYANKNDISLVIMGTQGASSLRTILLGSTTKKVFEQSDIPVLAIPEGTTSDSEGDIVLALDPEDIKPSIHFTLLSFIAEQLRKKINVIHVTDNPDSSNFEIDPDIYAPLKNSIGRKIILEGSDPLDTIKNYLSSNEVYIITMIRRKHSYLERLLVMSNTSSAVLTARVPLLMIPD